jgi:hypothetical protein
MISYISIGAAGAGNLFGQLNDMLPSQISHSRCEKDMSDDRAIKQTNQGEEKLKSLDKPPKR